MTRTINNRWAFAEVCHWALALIYMFALIAWELAYLIKWGYNENSMGLIYMFWFFFCIALNTYKFANHLGHYLEKCIYWFFYPLAFMVYVVAGYFARNKLRWFRNRWFYITLNQLWKKMQETPTI